MTVSVHDVAAYLLQIEASYKNKGFTPMQLHKLCFIADLMHSRATGAPLFHEYFVHTKTGPQYNELIPQHRGENLLFRWRTGDVENLGYGQRLLIEIVWKQYSSIRGAALAEFTLKQFEYQQTDLTS